MIKNRVSVVLGGGLLLLVLLLAVDVELEGVLAFADVGLGCRGWELGLDLDLGSLVRDVDPFLGLNLPVGSRLSGLPRLSLVPGLSGLSFEDHFFMSVHPFLFPLSWHILRKKYIPQVLSAEHLAKQDLPSFCLAQDPLLPRGHLVVLHILEISISCRVLVLASLHNQLLVVDSSDGDVSVG